MGRIKTTRSLAVGSVMLLTPTCAASVAACLDRMLEFALCPICTLSLIDPMSAIWCPAIDGMLFFRLWGLIPFPLAFAFRFAFAICRLG